MKKMDLGTIVAELARERNTELPYRYAGWLFAKFTTRLQENPLSAVKNRTALFGIDEFYAGVQVP